MALFTVTGCTQGGWGRARTAETLTEANTVAAEFRSGYDGLCSDSRVRIYKGEPAISSDPIRAWRGSPDTGWYEVISA